MTVRVDGHAEMSVLVEAMTRCAEPFVHSSGSCGFKFSGAVPARCRVCPLYDDERALRMISASGLAGDAVG